MRFIHIILLLLTTTPIHTSEGYTQFINANIPRPPRLHTYHAPLVQQVQHTNLQPSLSSIPPQPSATNTQNPSGQHPTSGTQSPANRQASINNQPQRGALAQIRAYFAWAFTPDEPGSRISRISSHG